METQCPQCAKRLRVPDDAAGKAVRCPACQAVISLPAGAAEAPIPGPRAPAPQAIAVEQWTVKTEDGQEYGPISRTDLDSWVSQGRLGPQCQLLRSGSAQWQWAADVFPQLASAASAPPVRAASPAPAAVPNFDAGKPSAGAPFVVSDNPYASPTSGAGRSSLGSRRIPDHLALAIFSLVCCGGLFAVPAIVYAAQANSMKSRGDYQGAARAAASAETWLYVAFGIGIVLTILSGLAQVAIHSQ